jgi:hypothetical protein
MCENKFFQYENKFIVGKEYETIRVNSYNVPYTSIKNSDEVGTIIPNTSIFLGKYIASWNYGYGDNSGRVDYFINNKGEKVSNYLDYDGKTRYREVKTLMDERIAFLNMIESIEDIVIEDIVIEDIVNQEMSKEHINRYILNPVISKEICSFMNNTI